MAYGDHQVANVPTEVEARTIGAPLRMPALDCNRCSRATSTPFVGLPTLGDLSGPAAHGSGYLHLGHRPEAAGPDDARSRRLLGTDPPPITNTAPNDTFGVDPHDTVIRNTPADPRPDRGLHRRGRDDHRPPAVRGHPCYEANWDGELP